ncbi:hypothetical protein O0I10_008621 [Lichtheimia ornata]|uniref:Uncharacterized protein n=1 Tax=Lichtheimia ornata TaxID=688661 RepID=A0AAD7UYW4_9FUNG|nr:uncharacterized protein O0I10_008621 [Lichtheimia ornata]KAJ8655735.1 hypothetical protein O0I10_008621 [Lichtheimia ornata]
MQHRQLIQLLTRAESACRAWDKEQSISASLLLSLSNITAQQRATMEQRFNFDVNTNRLVYKQACSFEDVFEKLTATLDAMDDIVHDLYILENEATKHLTRAMPEMLSTKTKPMAPSTESLIQTAAVRPQEVYEYIADLHYTYKMELQHKRMWMDMLPERASRPELLDDLRERWQTQPHLKPELASEISDRIKLYKQVHKVLTSTD